MIFIIKPILFSFLKSPSVKKLVIDMLKAYAQSTDNTVDDEIVTMVERGLG